VTATDEDKARLDSAVKPYDGFFTTFFVSPYSKYIARWAARRGLTPNQVTLFSMFLGVLAAAAFGTGERWGLIAGALLLQVAFTFDCVDGQLARYTRNFSAFGAWLDSVFDRGKEYLVYAGLAVGSTRGFGVDVWPLAASALTLQTVRHMFDFSYTDWRQETLGAVEPTPLGFSRELDRNPVTKWAKRIVVLPIGERFATISITAALWAPRTTFVVLLIWGGVAAIYSLSSRVLRTIV
jgi:phosphatidylglycerophosphate synthase